MPLFVTSSSSTWQYNNSDSTDHSVQTTLWVNSMANYKDAWVEQKNEMTRLENKGEGNSKAAQQVRARMIQYWNKMTPQQQRDIAMKYCPDTPES